MKEKIKVFFQKYWKLILTFTILIVLGAIVYVVLKYTGLADIDKIRAMLEEVGWWKYIVFVLLQVAFDFVLSFFPFTTMGFIGLGFILFPWWANGLLCALATLIISFINYFIGRRFGKRFGDKLIGAEEMAKAENFLNTRGTVYLPVMFLFPFFPDDALCLVAGASKMKFWYFSLVTLITRPIGVFTWAVMFKIFGEIISIKGIVNNLIDKLGLETGVIMIIIIILVVLMTIYFIIKIVRKIANKVDFYFLNKKEKEEAVKLQELAQNATNIENTNEEQVVGQKEADEETHHE